MERTQFSTVEHLVHIPAGEVTLDGSFDVPEQVRGIILFAHGSGSSRHSPRNRFVAQVLRESGLATLLIDLLTADEEIQERGTRRLSIDIGLFADRLIAATDWARQQDLTGERPIGYFGASTGAAAALVAAAARYEMIDAVVSRGGRPDLAGESLPYVAAATLLIVGSADEGVIELNENALSRLTQARKKELVLVPNATHLFEEPGAVEEVARLARDWFLQNLRLSDEFRLAKSGLHADKM